jgi:hypothetical protein
MNRACLIFFLNAGDLLLLHPPDFYSFPIHMYSMKHDDWSVLLISAKILQWSALYTLSWSYKRLVDVLKIKWAIDGKLTFNTKLQGKRKTEQLFTFVVKKKVLFFVIEVLISNGHSPQIRQNGKLLVRMCRGESHFCSILAKFAGANVSSPG